MSQQPTSQGAAFSRQPQSFYNSRGMSRGGPRNSRGVINGYRGPSNGFRGTVSVVFVLFVLLLLWGLPAVPLGLRATNVLFL